LIKGGPDVYGVEPLEGKKQENFRQKSCKLHPSGNTNRGRNGAARVGIPVFFVSNVSLFQVFEFNLFHIVDIL